MIKSLTLQTDEQPAASDIRELILERLDALRGLSPQVAVVLTSHMEGDFSAFLETIQEFFPDIDVLGCTTDGEVSLHAGPGRDTAQVTFLGADKCRFAAGVGRNLSSRPQDAIKEAYEQAVAKLGVAPVLAVPFPDGLTTLAIPLHELLPRFLGDGVTIVGGTAGDRFVIEKTFQFYGHEVMEDTLVLLLIGGPLLYGTSNEHGRRPVGRKHRLGRSEANVVYEIGENPAMDFYRNYIGENVEEYRQFPLMVYPDDGGTPFLSSAGFFDEDNASVVFVGVLPEDCSVQLSEGAREDILAASAKACEQALAAYPGNAPQVCMIFSCASRRHILGTMAPDELAFFKQSGCVPNAFGFYTYGEIAPANASGVTRLHSDTFVPLFLGEED